MDAVVDRDDTPQPVRAQTMRRRGARAVGLSLLGAAVLIPAVCFYLSRYLIREKHASRQRRGSRHALPQGFMVTTGTERISIPLTHVSEDIGDDTATAESARTTDPAPQARYVASSERDRFHVTECRWAARIQNENRIMFGSREDAIAAGFEPCGTCNP